MIEFSELRGPNKIFGSFCKINEPNILFGPLILENSIITPPLGWNHLYIKLTNGLPFYLIKQSLQLGNELCLLRKKEAC